MDNVFRFRLNQNVFKRSSWDNAFNKYLYLFYFFCFLSDRKVSWKQYFVVEKFKILQCFRFFYLIDIA